MEVNVVWFDDFDPDALMHDYVLSMFAGKRLQYTDWVTDYKVCQAKKVV